MAEPFKSTPASRVFGMGLPRRKVDNPGTIFGIEVDEPRWSLDPRLRRDMAEEQTLSMQEQALDAQQQQLQRQMRGQQAMDQAYSELEKGEEIENIFRKNPAMAMSPDFGQFVQAARYLQPSKAAQTLAPSIAKSIPAPYRDKYMALVNGDPRYAQDPLGAKTVVETEMGIDEQRGRLRKMGVDTSKLERRLYTPEEEADFEFRVKNDDPLSFYEKRKNLALERLKLWEDRDDTQIPDPKNPTLFVENPEFTKAKTLAVQAMDEHDAELLRRINPQAATATNITSPAAMGGGLPAPVPASQQVQAPAPSLDEELSRVPVTEQPKFLERKRAEQVEASKVNEEWTKAKKDLESKLKEQFPDKAYEGTNVKPLEQLALQIVRGDMIRDDDANAPTDEFGQTAQIPIHEAALRRLNLPRFDKAFTEPGKARKYLFGLLGSQDVTYNELIRDWAKGFLSQRGLIQTPVQENATVPREEVDKAVNFLNKKVAMPQ